MSFGATNAQQIRPPLDDFSSNRVRERERKQDSTRLSPDLSFDQRTANDSTSAQSGAAGTSDRLFIDSGIDPRLRHEPRRQASTGSAQSTVPYWSDSFTYQGLEFTYRMVGTDPGKGSKTTTIPTVIVPLRFVFADGSVFDSSTDLIDGQTPVQGWVNSPIFQNHDWVLGGTHVGNTQYADAFQRANFWNLVSTAAPDYHVLLGQPTIMPTQTIIVPAGSGETFVDSATSHPYGHVDPFFLYEQVVLLFDSMNIRTDSLPIFALGPVFFGSNAGIHLDIQRQSVIQPFIWAVYDYHDTRQSLPDTSVLAHEIGEWLDDPFGTNYVPGWNYAGRFNEQCAFTQFFGGLNILEVADPLETIPIVSISDGVNNYHVVDLAFVDFFTRNSTSRSVNGQYFFFEAGAASSPCTGLLQPASERFIDFPGSKSTEIFGLNNGGDVVGYYRDQNNLSHGFFYDGRSYRKIEPPGAVKSVAQEVTDSRQIFGSFFDGGGWHGYYYQYGIFKVIDFPGAISTRVFGGNDQGDSVGAYVDALGNFHGFVLSRGRFQTINAPFGSQTEVGPINERREFAGDSFGGPLGDLEYGFVHDGSGFFVQNAPGAVATLPYGLNNVGTSCGLYFNENGYSSGYITIFGHPHFTAQYVYSANDLNQIAGSDIDFTTGKLVGFIATLPLANSSSNGNR